MNFIRPEVRAHLWRYREVAFTGVIVLFGVRLIGRGVDLSSSIYIGLGIALSAIGAGLLFSAFLRVRFYKPVRAVGVVEVKEREIAYLGPDSGSYVSLDDLTRLEIVTKDSGPVADDVFWVLTHSAGLPLLIPASAQGTDLLFDAFAALPGIQMEQVVKAMGSTQNNRFLIWEK